MIELSTDYFSYDSQNRVFACEISTLQLRELPSTIKLVNKDGIGVFANLGSVEKDREGDVQSWTYFSQTPEKPLVLKSHFKVVIFND